MNSGWAPLPAPETYQQSKWEQHFSERTAGRFVIQAAVDAGYAEGRSSPCRANAVITIDVTAATAIC